MKRQLLSGIMFLVSVYQVHSAEIVIEPTGTGDDAMLIQNNLDALQQGDTLRLNGDFTIAGTIYFPSDFTWILSGSLTLGDHAVLDKVGVVEPGVDSRRSTGITEKPGGASNIDMSGGIYEGNAKNNSSPGVRFINFTSVTNSRFHDMTINDASDDNFTIGAKSTYNECRNLTGSFAGGNALTDKGDYNKWYDCIAEDCASDGWTPKCRNSEFYRCTGRRNAGPGFGCFARLDGSNPDQGEIITGNKFYACESYDNERGGFSFNIAGTSGPGSVVRDNFIQAICHNNKMQGVTFRNKQPDGIIENNEIDILVYGNLGHNSDGSLSGSAGGLGTDGGPISGITGSVVAYGNGGYDVNIKSAGNCTIAAYYPDDQNQPVLNNGSNGNNINVTGFNCSDQLDEWCQQKYCSLPVPPLPGPPAGLTAMVVSFNRIDLSWTDTTGNEDGFMIERKTTGSYSEIGRVDANVTSFSSTGLTELTEYTFRVRAFNVSGYSGYTNEISATTGSDSSTSAHYPSTAGDVGLHLYPNPFHETGHVSYTVSKECFVSIKVYDSSGRELDTLVHEEKHPGQYSIAFNATGLPEGAYFCRILAGNRVVTKKMILLR